MENIDYNILKIDLKNAIRLNQHTEIDTILEKIGLLIDEDKDR